MSDLFGHFCYIDTPWIAGKKTRYRIIASRLKSNCWSEVPVRGKAELAWHDHDEEIVIAVLDTLVDTDSTLLRFALKDIEVIETEQPERKKGRWIHKPDIYLDEQTWECSECGEPWIFIEGTPSENKANFCPNCGSYNGGGEE